LSRRDNQTPDNSLARQSRAEHHAAAATPDSHPDCRRLLIQIAARHLGYCEPMPRKSYKPEEIVAKLR